MEVVHPVRIGQLLCNSQLTSRDHVLEELPCSKHYFQLTMSAPLPAYCTALLSWKSDSGITFAEIAAQLGKPEVWTTALFFGQAKTDDETARKLLAITQTDYNDTLKYYTIDDPTVKHCPGWAVVHGLSGKGVDSRGVDGMVTRGGTWEWPPKVKQCDMITTHTSERPGSGHLSALRSPGGVR